MLNYHSVWDLILVYNLVLHYIQQIEYIKNVEEKFRIDMGDSHIIASEKLNDLNKLQRIGREYKMNNNISKSYDKVSESLRTLKESGQTWTWTTRYVMY